MNLINEQKKALGLCFRCNEKWYQGHKCAKGLHALEEEGEDLEDSQMEDGSPPVETGVLEDSVEEQLVTLSISQSEGHTKYEDIMGDIFIYILIDTRATHSFINPVLAAELHLYTKPHYFEV
jgi:hypothetical protein